MALTSLAYTRPHALHSVRGPGAEEKNVGVSVAPGSPVSQMLRDLEAKTTNPLGPSAIPASRWRCTPDTSVPRLRAGSRTESPSARAPEENTNHRTSDPEKRRRERQTADGRDAPVGCGLQQRLPRLLLGVDLRAAAAARV